MNRCMGSDWGDILPSNQEDSPIFTGSGLDNWLNRVAICVAVTSVSRYYVYVRLLIKLHQIVC